MKKTVLAVVLGIVLFIVLALTTFLVPEEDDDVCTPSGGSSSSAGGSGEVNDDGLALPMDNATDSITSGFRTPDRPDHNGLDVAKENGDPIYAIADGTVAQAGPADGFGQWIVLDHEDKDGKKYSTVYGHMFPDGIHVHTGDTVKAGQHIADQGYNGGVDPAGPAGGHLHVEHWPGGRLTGGSPVDPRPLIDQAASGKKKPADTADKDTKDNDSKDKDAKGKNKAKDDSKRGDQGSTDLPPSDLIQSEEHLQYDSVKLARAVAKNFPQVESIGGWRPTDKISDDHPSGRAVDIMIPDYSSSEGKQLGDDIRDYVYGNQDEFNVEYIIWRQELFPNGGEPYKMEDRGSDNENHFNHVHVTVEGGGIPKPGEDFGSAPSGGSKAPGSASGTVGKDCKKGLDSSLDTSLNDGEIPEELRKWIKLGGRVCKQVPSPLLAGLLYHESGGFNATAESAVGAQGYAQFMPDTWAGRGAKVDDNGEIAGPPGSGSPSDPADATMAAARFLCDLAEGQEEGISSGKLKGDPTELMLAAYNAGPGAVEQYGGVPPYSETQNYVKVVPEEAAKFAGADKDDDVDTHDDKEKKDDD